MRILVVDDHEMIHRGMEREFRSTEWTLIPAKSGSAALQLLAQVPRPNVTVVDLGLPGEDGWRSYHQAESVA